MNKVVCMGELLIDFTAKSIGKIRDVSIFEKNAGGAPANVAVCIARLGGVSSMITQLGCDEFGYFLADVLNKNNVDTTDVFFTNKARTALAFVSLDETGERDFEFYRKPSSDLFLGEDLISDEIIDGSIFHFGSVDLVDYPIKYAHKKAIEIAREKGMLISFDPNLRYNLWESRQELIETVNEFLPYADIVKVNAEELKDITGESEEAAAIAKMLEYAPKLLLITRGADGSDAYRPGKCVHADSFKCDCIDTTGAGDTFMGTILFQLQRENINRNNIDKLDCKTLKRFLTAANKASSLSVAKYGAIPSMPRYDEVFND